MIGLEANFSHHSGDSRTLELTINDEDGAALDITTATEITWALSKKVSDSVIPKGGALITKTLGSGVTLIDGPTGRADVAITPEDTADMKEDDYYHEVQLELGGDTSTVLFGTVTLLKDLI